MADETVSLEIEIIDAGSGPAKKMASALGGLRSSLGQLQGAFGKLGSAVGGAFGRLRTAFTQMGGLGGIFSNLRARAAAGLDGVRAAMGRLAESGGAFRALRDRIFGVQQDLGVFGTRTIGGLGELRERVRVSVGGIAQAIRGSKVGQAALAVADSFNAGMQRVSAFAQSVRTRVGGALNRLRTSSRKIGGEVMGALFGKNWFQGLQAAQNSVGVFGGKVADRLKAMASSVGSITGKAFRGLGGAIQKIPIGAFIEKAKSGLLIGGAVAGAIGAGLASLSIGMADFAQKSKTAFGMLLKNQDLGNQAFDRSNQIAQRFGLDLKDTALQYQKFLSMGFNMQESENVLKMGADMRALGNSSEKVMSVFDAMGKIKATGSLQGDELMMLAEAGVNIGDVYDALGKKFGKTREEIIKMKEAGAIKSDDALGAIGDVILATTGGKQFGDAGAKIADTTLSGMASRLKSGVQALFLQIGEEIGPEVSKTFGALGKEIMGFMKGQGGKDMMKGMVTGIKMAADGLRTAIPLVKQFLSGFGSGAVSAFQALAPALGQVFGLFTGKGQNASNILTTIGSALGKIVVFAGAVIVAIGAIAGAAVALGAGMMQFWQGIFNGVVNTIGSIVFAITDWWANIKAIFTAEGMSIGQKALEIGSMIIMGIVNGIKALIMLPVQAIQGLVGGVIGAAKSALGISSPSKIFATMGDQVTSGFAGGMDPAMASSAAATMATSAIGGAAGALGGAMLPSPGIAALTGQAPTAMADTMSLPGPGAGGGGVSALGGATSQRFQVTVNVHLGGDGGSAGMSTADAKKKGKAAGDAAGESVISQLEDWALEQGL